MLGHMVSKNGISLDEAKFRHAPTNNGKATPMVYELCQVLLEGYTHY